MSLDQNLICPTEFQSIGSLRSGSFYLNFKLAEIHLYIGLEHDFRNVGLCPTVDPIKVYLHRQLTSLWGKQKCNTLDLKIIGLTPILNWVVISATVGLNPTEEFLES
jgi:hypothetical protein